VRPNKYKHSVILPLSHFADKPNPAHRSRWLLKDFYDHISLDSQESRNDRQKQREDIVGKLKRIS